MSRAVENPSLQPPASLGGLPQSRQPSPMEEGQLPDIVEGTEADDHPDHYSPPPDNVPTPEQTPAPEDSSDVMAKAAAMFLKSVGKEVSKDMGFQANKPDQFSGEDRSKFDNFLFQVDLYTSSDPRHFDLDAKKVNFALSYLSGLAQESFRTLLRTNPQGAWRYDWQTFEGILRRRFGQIDAESRAAQKIDHLKMKDNYTVQRYLVNFEKNAVLLGWDDRALRHRFYSGLPERIQDEISRVGKPDTYDEMVALAERIDLRYWERHFEKHPSGDGNSKKSGKQTSTSSNANSDSATKSSGQSNSNKSSSKDSSSKGKSSGQKNAQSGGSGSFGQNRSGNSSSGSQSRPNLEGKLGADGRLTEQEKKRHRERNLCMYCTSSEHAAENCPRKEVNNQRKLQARAAQVSVAGDSAGTSSSPKN